MEGQRAVAGSAGGGSSAAGGDRLAPLDHVRKLYEGVQELLPPGRELTRKIDLLRAVRSPQNVGGGGGGGGMRSPSPTSAAIHLAFTSPTAAGAAGASPLGSFEAIGDVDRLLKAASRRKAAAGGSPSPQSRGVGGTAAPFSDTANVVGGSNNALQDQWGSLVAGGAEEASRKALETSAASFILESGKHNKAKKSNEAKEKRASDLRAELEALQRENSKLKAIESHTHLSSLNTTLVFGDIGGVVAGGSGESEGAGGVGAGGSSGGVGGGANPWDSDEEEGLLGELGERTKQKQRKRFGGTSTSTGNLLAGVAAASDFTATAGSGGGAASPGGVSGNALPVARSAHNYLGDFPGALGATLSTKTSMLESQAEALQKRAAEQERKMQEALASRTPVLRVAGASNNAVPPLLGSSMSSPVLMSAGAAGGLALPPLLMNATTIGGGAVGGEPFSSSAAGAGAISPGGATSASKAKKGKKAATSGGSGGSGPIEVTVSFSEAAQVARIKELQLRIALTKRSIARKAFQNAQFERVAQRLKSNAATFERHLKFLDDALKAATKETQDVHGYLRILEASRDGALVSLHNLQRLIAGEETIRSKDLDEKKAELSRARQIDELRNERESNRRQLEAELNGDLSLQQEAELLQTVAVLEQRVKELQAERKTREERAMKLQDAYLQIKASTGIQDLLVMAKRFEKGQEITRQLEQEKLDAQERLRVAKRELEAARESFESMTTTSTDGKAVASTAGAPLLLLSPTMIEGKQGEELQLALPSALISPVASSSAAPFFTSAGQSITAMAAADPSTKAWHEQITALQATINEEKAAYRTHASSIERLESLIRDSQSGSLAMMKLLWPVAVLEGESGGRGPSSLPPSAHSSIIIGLQGGSRGSRSRDIMTIEELARAQRLVRAALVRLRDKALKIISDSCEFNASRAEEEARELTEKADLLQDKLVEAAKKAEAEASLVFTGPARPRSPMGGGGTKGGNTTGPFLTALAEDDDSGSANNNRPVTPGSRPSLYSFSPKGLRSGGGNAAFSFGGVGGAGGVGSLNEAQVKAVHDAKSKASEASARASFLRDGARAVERLLQAATQPDDEEGTPHSLLYLFSDLMALGREELLRVVMAVRTPSSCPTHRLPVGAGGGVSGTMSTARAAVASALLAAQEQQQQQEGAPGEGDREQASASSLSPLFFLSKLRLLSRSTMDSVLALPLPTTTATTTPLLADRQHEDNEDAGGGDEEDEGALGGGVSIVQDEADAFSGGTGKYAESAAAAGRGSPKARSAGVTAGQGGKGKVKAAGAGAALPPNSPSVVSIKSGISSSHAAAVGMGMGIGSIISQSPEYAAIVASSSPAAAAAALQNNAMRAGKGPILQGTIPTTAVSANASTVSAPRPPAPQPGLTQEQVAIARAAQQAAARLTVSREDGKAATLSSSVAVGDHLADRAAMKSSAVDLRAAMMKAAAQQKANQAAAAAAAANKASSAKKDRKKDDQDEDGEEKKDNDETARGGSARAKKGSALVLAEVLLLAEEESSNNDHFACTRRP
jgi:hypothetical protein